MAARWGGFRHPSTPVPQHPPPAGTPGSEPPAGERPTKRPTHSQVSQPQSAAQKPFPFTLIMPQSSWNTLEQVPLQKLTQIRALSRGLIQGLRWDNDDGKGYCAMCIERWNKGDTP